MKRIPMLVDTEELKRIISELPLTAKTALRIFSAVGFALKTESDSVIPESETRLQQSNPVGPY